MVPSERARVARSVWDVSSGRGAGGGSIPRRTRRLARREAPRDRGRRGSEARGGLARPDATCEPGLARNPRVPMRGLGGP